MSTIPLVISKEARKWMEQNPEEWRPVVGYEGWYEVSNWANVRRIRGGQSTFVGRLLKPSVRSNRCTTVCLVQQPRSKHILLHQLVMAAFVGPRPDGKEINHLDGDRTNNCLYNLEYCTKSENILHAFSMGLMIAKRGEQCPWSKLSDEQVMCIRALRHLIPNTVTAKAFSISIATVKTIQKYQTWRHIA